MIRVVIFFRIWKSFSLCRQRVDDDRTVVDLFRFLKSTDEVCDVMPIDVADVFESKLVDESSGQDRRGDRVLYRLRRVAQMTTDSRNAFERVADLFLQMLITLRFLDTVEIAAQRSDRGCDRHSVVVEDDDQTRFQMSGLIDSFHRHAAGERRVADQRTDVKVLVFRIACDSHPERRRQRCRCVSGAERVVFRLVTAKKSAQSAKLFDRVKLVAPSGEDLVRICLMPDVPDKPIVRSVKNIVHRDRKLDSAQRCSGVSADTRASIDNELPNLVGDLLQVLNTQLAKIGRRIDLG